MGPHSWWTASADIFVVDRFSVTCFICGSRGYVFLCCVLSAGMLLDGRKDPAGDVGSSSASRGKHPKMVTKTRPVTMTLVRRAMRAGGTFFSQVHSSHLNC